MKKLLFLLSFQLSVFGCQYSFAQWQQTSLPYTGPIQTLASDSSNIFVGTQGGGVYVSTDNDRSWTAGNIGLKDHALYIDRIAINGTKIYIVTREGIYLSVNNGTNWTYIGPPVSSGDTIINAIAVDGNNIFMCIPRPGQGVYFSDNDGGNWTAINNGFTGTPNVYALSAKDSNIVAGIYMGGVYLSTDKGLHWNANTNGIPSDEVIGVFVRSGNNIFAGGHKVYLVFA